MGDRQGPFLRAYGASAYETPSTTARRSASSDRDATGARLRYSLRPNKYRESGGIHKPGRYAAPWIISDLTGSPQITYFKVVRLDATKSSLPGTWASVPGQTVGLPFPSLLLVRRVPGALSSFTKINGESVSGPGWATHSIAGTP